MSERATIDRVIRVRRSEVIQFECKHFGSENLEPGMESRTAKRLFFRLFRPSAARQSKTYYFGEQQDPKARSH